MTQETVRERVMENDSVPGMFHCSNVVIESMYVATNLEHLFMPLYGVCVVIRFYSANGESRLYYRLTPAVFVWLRSQLAAAATRMASGEIEREKYDRAASRFKAVEIWAAANIGEELIAAAAGADNFRAVPKVMARDNNSPPAPGGQAAAANRLTQAVGPSAGPGGLPPYTEPDFGAFPAGPIGKARPAAELAMWSSVEKKWFRCLQPQPNETKPEEEKSHVPANRQPASDPAAHPAVATVPRVRARR
jgi:hypothetical protein